MATYYVRKDGNDANDGTTDDAGGAKLTVQAGVNLCSAGDTLMVGAGVYAEEVETAANGASGSLITVDGQDVATIHSFQFRHPYNKLTGLLFFGYATAFRGTVEILEDAHYSELRDCVMDNDLFEDVIGVRWIPKTGSTKPYDTTTASNCVIDGCTIKGCQGQQVFNIYGDDNEITNNLVFDCAQTDFIRLWGRRNRIAGNTFRNNFYIPGNGNHMDFVQTFGEGGFGSEDHIIENNVVRDIDGGQLAQLSRALNPNIQNWIFRNNLFCNISAAQSCSVPGIKHFGNVFYQCNFENQGQPLVFGARTFNSGNSWDGSSGTDYAHNAEVKNCIFLDCGGPVAVNSGWYSFDTDLTGVSADYNYVAKSQLSGTRWNAVRANSSEESIGDPGGWDNFGFYEVNGINGGDQGIINPEGLNFRIRPDSALRGAGVPTASNLLDAYGTTRDASTPDIGRHEATSTATPATIYVDASAGAGGDGSSGSPYQTIAEGVGGAVAGDTVLVAAGDYGEYVQTAVAGAIDEPITVLAAGVVTSKSFRLSHSCWIVDGFTLAKAQNLWSTHVRVEASSDDCVVRNCSIGNGVYAISDDMLFDDSDNSVSSSSVDFEAAGFEVGGLVYYGGTAIDGYVYDNHDNNNEIATVSANKMTFVNALVPESQGATWAPVFASGVGHDGVHGVKLQVSGSVGPSRFTVTRNTFDGVFGTSIYLFGDNHFVTHNEIRNTNGWYGLRCYGYPNEQIYIEDNYWHDSTKIINYTPEELETIPHPPGADWYDYSVGYLHITQDGEGIYFRRNWLQNINQPLAQISEGAESRILEFRNNVCIGVAASASCGWDVQRWRRNLFYKCSFDLEQSNAVSIGGNAPATADRLDVRFNIFYACGSREVPNFEGGYFIVDSTNSIGDSNRIVGSEVEGYPEKPLFEDPAEPNGVHGGDPLFYDEANIAPTDGYWWGDESGLCRAVASVDFDYWGPFLLPYKQSSSTPRAHFRVAASSASIGWHDEIGEDYNPDWMAELPWHRVNLIRPWDTADALCDAGTSVTFDASDTLGNDTITDYAWDFGDGSSTNGASATVEHVFATAGEREVTLTVTNENTNTDSITKTFTVLGTATATPPNPPEDLTLTAL